MADDGQGAGWCAGHLEFVVLASRLEFSRMVHERIRGLVLPAADRAHWVAPLGGSGPLLYLAWGERQFGAAPVPARMHHGWVCALVERGAPVLVHEGRREPVPATTLLLIGPNHAFGWADARARSSKLLVWMWQRSASGPLAHLRDDAFVRVDVRADELAEFGELHQLSRREVHRADRCSADTLAAIPVLLEARLALLDQRGVDGKDERVQQAMQWIEKHLATRQPLARLADYLGLSQATVQRLFRRRLGTTVMKTIVELRCHEAERLLRLEGTTIKEVAYMLGYRHPHDFSRAFRKHTGRLPRRPERQDMPR
jgi:AraC family transcriptional regulator of arabinose operon